ncbi:MAG: hypothetical protein LW628_10705, partial [Fimbriimonadaceae bacterium]|nr:hypothetical protein [Fimbriimonadaceae bacterium]
MFATLLATTYFGIATMAVQRPNIRDRFDYFEYNIPMRDGVKLYTIAWVPKTLQGNSPMLMERTCYGA